MSELFRQMKALVLPLTVLIVIPALIVEQWNPGWHALMIPGSVLAAIGLSVIAATIRMFILIGRGTLAPWDPTRKLVTGGLYAYVRNPMIMGVLTVLAGEALMFKSANIAIWAVLFFIINSVYFILSEEPGLEKRFGDEYLEYKKNVPRWLARATPWRPGR